MMTIAEKFCTIDALLQGSFRKYPEERLNSAWESKIYPDHGWGGKGGESTDAIFLAKFEESLAEAKSISREAMKSIASKIKADPAKGTPVVVFNSLSWLRDDPVSFTISFDPGDARGIKMKDASGEEVPVQINEILKYSDGSLRKISAVFIATGVSSIGFKTYYLVPEPKNSEVFSFNGNVVETPFYKVQFEDGGIKSIYDKELNKELLKTGKILGGDVFTLKSFGNGAGEFADIQKTEMDGFDIVSNHLPEWK